MALRLCRMFCRGWILVADTEKYPLIWKISVLIALILNIYLRIAWLRFVLHLPKVKRLVSGSLVLRWLKRLQIVPLHLEIYKKYRKIQRPSELAEGITLPWGAATRFIPVLCRSCHQNGDRGVAPDWIKHNNRVFCNSCVIDS